MANNYNCQSLLQGKTDWLTGLDDASEDGGGVDSGAVPTSMAELVLTLVDGVDSSRLDRIHHVHVVLTDLTLLLDQSTDLVALLFLSNVVHGRDSRYRPATYTTKYRNRLIRSNWHHCWWPRVTFKCYSNVYRFGIYTSCISGSLAIM